MCKRSRHKVREIAYEEAPITSLRLLAKTDNKINGTIKFETED